MGTGGRLSGSLGVVQPLRKFDNGHRLTQKNTDITKSSLFVDHFNSLRVGLTECKCVFIATNYTPLYGKEKGHILNLKYSIVTFNI